MEKITKKYDVEGTIIIEEISDNWHYVHAEDDEASCKSFGFTTRKHSVFEEEKIHANKGMTSEEAIRIVAAKAKNVYDGHIIPFQINEINK
jgi:hypothetical protein